MICIYREYDPDLLTDNYHVVIQADETPSTFPLDGSTVKNMKGEYLGANVQFAPGSMLHCVDTGKNYFMNEAGTEWLEDGASA